MSRVWSDHSNNIYWTLHIIKSLVTQFSASFRYFVSHRFTQSKTAHSLSLIGPNSLKQLIPCPNVKDTYRGTDKVTHLCRLIFTFPARHEVQKNSEINGKITAKSDVCPNYHHFHFISCFHCLITVSETVKIFIWKEMFENCTYEF